MKHTSFRVIQIHFFVYEMILATSSPLLPASIPLYRFSDSAVYYEH